MNVYTCLEDAEDSTDESYEARFVCHWGQRKAGGKPKRGKTALLNQPEGSGDKEVTGDTDDEIEEIEEIEGTGDPAIGTTYGRPELEEAEVQAQQRQYMPQQARDQRAADQLARSAADYDESTAWEAMNLAQRAFAQMERMTPRIAGIQIELDSNQFAVTQLQGQVAALSKRIMDMAAGVNGPDNNQRAAQRTSLTADLIEIHDTRMIRPITMSHPLAEVHQIVTFLKSFCEAELFNLIVAEMEILMVIQKGNTALKDSNKVIMALKADHEIGYERNHMLETLTGMFMDRFNVKGSDVSLDFNTISTITAALGNMCKRAIALVSAMDTSGVATNMQTTQVVAKMTYPPDHAEEYKGLTWASAKDLAKTFVVRFAFIMGKRLTRNLKIQSQAKAAAPHYEVGEGSGGPKPTVPPKPTDHLRGSLKDKRYDLWPTGKSATVERKTAWCAKNMCEGAMTGTCTRPPARCNFLHHVSPLGLDTDQVLTMIKNGRAARSKH
eukprot:jgi/Tetstr1/444332/TSEL_032223.t1